MSQFAHSFFLGTATSSYQIEGHLPGTSIWDTFVESRNLEPVGNATNHFLLFREDVQLMHELGFRHYRFSISWTRIMPKRWNEIDPDGIRFYHDLLDELHAYNMTPYVTLYHWDLPEYLSPGWTDPAIVGYFVNYSAILFEEYKDKVTYWMTINEPLTTASQGYGDGSFAPGIRNQQYTAGHYQLLAHAYAANYFRTHNYTGQIGLVINANWFEPKGSNPGPARRELLRNLGWFADPLFFGRYPDELLGETPTFTEEESNLLVKSFDFFALNHYTTSYVGSNGEFSDDPTWIQAQSSWLRSVPWGLNRILHFIHDRYGDVPIYITECGFSMVGDNHRDVDRTAYLTGYIQEAQRAREEGVDVRGFFVWSFLDNFEWASGYRETFGIVYVDNRHENYTRVPKESAYTLKTLIG